MKIYIGTSGWQYYHWKGKFYPEDLPSKDFLKFYAKYFNTVEINTSFYHFTKKSTFEKWLTQINTDLNGLNTDYSDFMPRGNKRKVRNVSILSEKFGVSEKSVLSPKKSVADFLFSIKLHRLFTHFRKLKLNKDDKRILKETIESYKVLGKNLGPILIQLPPSLKKDLKALEKFLKCFDYPNRKPNILTESSDRIKSTRIARPNNDVYPNDNRMNYPNNGPNEIFGKHSGNKFGPNSGSDMIFGGNSGKVFGKNSGNMKIAIEFRHKSWLDKETYNFLKKKKIAFVISDSPRWPTDIVKTADFVYIRFHGKPHLFASKYEKEELQRYAKEIKKLKPKTLFAYFNNDAEGYAVENALEFKKIF
jgi:uncharacterized protein YecE (DUF72 family)